MSGTSLAVILLASLGQNADPPRPRGEADAIDMLRASQLAVVIDDQDDEVRFRATLIGRDGKQLLLLTAGHCVVGRGEGLKLRLSQGSTSCMAVVREVVRNPNYDSKSLTAVPGADNALISVEAQADDEKLSKWVASLAVARVGTNPTPAPDGEVVTIYMVDQKEAMHRIRAGNFSNPRWLEWGDRYRPIPGDSGSGVFVLGSDDEGALPVLIGVVTDRSSMGGGASVVFLRLRWFAEAVLRHRPPPKAGGTPEKSQS